MIQQVFINSVLREEWNGVTKRHRVWNASGVLTLDEAYTPTQSQAVDVTAPLKLENSNESQIRANIISDMAVYQAHLDKTNSGLAGEFTGNNIGAMLKEIYRGLRRLDRMALERFDGTT
jgi:hypothetical protein